MLEPNGDTFNYKQGNFSRTADLVGIVPIDPATGQTSSFSEKRQYTLLAGATATGSQVGPISGGDYIWRAESTNFNGATATLQYLGLDGATWYPVRNAANTADVTLTATGSVAIGVAQGSVLRVAISGGTPAPMNSVIGGL
ncbi:DUF5110 domain-containing protein [Agrobacterium sp. S2/73]|uniref:DUF5110 domain-containing protein n=1 Tax=unclassified Agrobacterium TaxID=2632611 RepID=UPI001AD9A8F5|nr:MULTISPECIES: DUF5110 domain-containing protein [unclassified Agrobacterium]MBO9108714.1 DUF5110 domain-containing protein [Agrobacterium sp. S2/73]QXZ73527.1 DUF5110 domain-containing protein [Agrobacterium sp. S7/73]